MKKGAGEPKLAPRDINLPTEEDFRRGERSGSKGGVGHVSDGAGRKMKCGAEDEDDFGLGEDGSAPKQAQKRSHIKF